MEVFIISIIILILIYKRTKKLKISLLMALFMMLSGLLTMLISESLQKIINIQDNILGLVQFIFIAGIAYGVGWIISKIYKKYPVNNEKIREYSTYFVFLSLLVVYMFIYMFVNSVIKLDYLNMIFSALLLLLIAMSLLLYKENLRVQYEKTQAENDNKHLEQYSVFLEVMMKEFRSFKHDYSNILTTISGYLQSEDMNGLKEYYHKEILPYSADMDKANIRLALLGNIRIRPLKGILSAKVIEALNMELNVFIDSEEIIEDINMNVVDLCRIVGILMDNAIEGARTSDAKRIDFGIIKKNETVIIIINNSCLRNIPEIHELLNSGFTTKGNGRGIGLSNVKEIIDTKYTNVTLNIEIDRTLGVFKQRILIRNEKENYYA